MPKRHPDPPANDIRLFVALDMPEPVSRVVETVQKELRGKPYLNARYTPRHNLHLTLKFLGEQPPERLDAIRDALGTIDLGTFSATLGDVGVFASRGMLRIIWIHLAGDGVVALQQAVDSALEGLFEPEQQFMSHLTIARIRNVDNRQQLLEDVAAIRPSKLIMPVTRFALKQSTLTPDGPVYKTLQTYPLAGSRP